jgi:DNA-binding response OmpR family regulator
MRLLIAEDEFELLRSLKAVFERNKYTVDTVENGLDAYLYAARGHYDGIILDVMMPNLNGIKVVSKLREDGIKTPVLLLTAKSEIEDRVTGLDAGADDYLTKPFAVSELLARVRAMLRRKDDFIPNQLRFGDLVLDPTTYTLCCGEKTQRLSGKEFQIMEFFMQHPQQILQTAQLMEHIWGWESDADVSVVWVNVSNLRKKLNQLDTQVMLRTNPGIGYSLEKKDA